MPCESIPSDRFGRIDLARLERSMKHGRIGTVVATAGTTSIGAVDDIGAIRGLADRYGARVHVDAAYGGFFQLLAKESEHALRAETAAALRAICNADSIVIDPHKHGLQPYGCGSVLFRDSTVGRFYQHDSPYTYFTSSELHLGEISLECSRSGAAAAAFWATLRAIPLTSTGLGAILRRTRAAAVNWSVLLSAESSAHLVVNPELDIVAFYLSPASGSRRASAISHLTQSIFESLMTDPAYPVHLATLRVSPAVLPGHAIEWDIDQLLVLRSVLMKPEHYDAVGTLHRSVMSHAGQSNHT